MADLLSDIEDSVLTITLNRPDKLNALSPDMREGLIELLQKQADNLSCRAILIRGNGRGFCTGADVQPEQILKRRDNIGEDINHGINRIVRLLTTLPVPVVTAVNGAAAGAGVSLALASDIMVTNRDAVFHLSFARIGAVMDGGSSWFLTRAIGPRRTASLALNGGRFDAEQALAWGLAHEVTDNEQLWSVADDIARKFAFGPSIALGLIKREITLATEVDLNTALSFEAESQQTAFNSEDFVEGIRAHQEKRKAAFRGC